MHARVSTFQSPPEQVTDAAVDNVRANLVPRVLEMDGNRGAIFLMDRDTGRTMTITLWDSEESLRASEEKANQVREAAAQTTSASIGDVQRFEAPVVELR
jgi:heme-degrading monooxygenase HmoA